jgi:hypothetical protein
LATARFGREPPNAKDLHRSLCAADDLDEVLAWQEERTVTHNLTLHYDRMMLMLDPTPLARGLVRVLGVALRRLVLRKGTRFQVIEAQPLASP